MNIAGPVKNNRLIRRGFLEGERRLLGQLASGGFRCLHQERHMEVTGNEGFYVVEGVASALKKLTVELEDRCKIGRLLDLDVLDSRGEKAERQAMGLSARRCLVCGEPGVGLRPGAGDMGFRSCGNAQKPSCGRLCPARWADCGAAGLPESAV